MSDKTDAEKLTSALKLIQSMSLALLGLITLLRSDKVSNLYMLKALQHMQQKCAVSIRDLE